MVGSEREGPSDPRKRESMHRIARWAGAAALSLTYATSWQARLVAEGVDKIAPPYTWKDLLDISNTLELGWEYGQELVGAAHADREGAWAAFRLFSEPSGSYRKSPFLRTTLEHSQTEGKFSVGLGDSYMLGEYDNTSPLTLYKDLMIERRGVSGWVDYIVAQRGKTTEEIIRDQVLSPKVKGELDKWDVFDAWSSVGANDFIEVATTIDAIQELKLVG
ncbi:MAG: hypothetical protein NUV69_02165 [Candidatus Curtissbacteria bacterium]|nr:hypothetical protein [Candidatus Curtissbacteria bacterium]